MNGGMKIFLAFLGGVAAGATGLAWINRNRLDFSHLKPVATDYLAKGINLKDQMMCKVLAMKEDFEDIAAEAREQVDQNNIANSPEHQNPSEQ